jgi:hypothetical protein
MQKPVQNTYGHVPKRPNRLLHWLFLVCLIGSSWLSILPGVQAQTTNPPLEIDLSSVTEVPAEFHAALRQALLQDPVALAQQNVTVSAWRTTDGWFYAVIVPTRIIGAGWDDVEAKDIIDIIGYADPQGGWLAFTSNQPQFAETLAQAPSDFVSAPAPIEPGVANTMNYLFPWAAPQRWYKTQGWHSGNALDFQPVVRTDPGTHFAVLASERGRLETICNDGVQINARIVHPNGATTIYVHLSAQHYRRDLVGQEVVQGQYLGLIYVNGSVGNSYSTACGWGTGAHLHFVLPARNLALNGLAAETISAAAFATQYQSSNQRRDVARYQAEFVGQSFGNRMTTGSTQQVSITVRNTGTATWDSGTRLAPSPRDVASPFYDPATWRAPARITSAGTVPPGSNATFNFTLRAPSTPGQYVIRFSLLQEGVTWFNQPADGAIFFPIEVVAPAPVPPAAPDSLRFVSRTPASITINWRDNATNETSYRVYRWDGALRNWRLVGTLPPNSTSFTNTGLTYRYGYSYLIAAVNAAGERRSANFVTGFIAVAPNDANNDGYSDLFWRNRSSGLNVVHMMRGGSLFAREAISTLSNQSWQIVGSGDFNGDGHADLLWRNALTGSNAINFIRNGVRQSTSTIGTVADQQWRVQAVADVNNDGFADILWRHSITGANSLHLMRGAQRLQSIPLRTVSDRNWRIMGVGDFNADGFADILWRHATTGANAIHFTDGTKVTASLATRTVADSNWRIVGVGDFNGDGRSDILWRHARTGQNVIYFMSGSSVINSTQIHVISDMNWRVVGIGDYNRDGFADILWRNRTTGANTIHFIRRTQLLQSARIQTVSDLRWLVVGTGSNVSTSVGPISPLGAAPNASATPTIFLDADEAEAFPWLDDGSVSDPLRIEWSEAADDTVLVMANEPDLAVMEWTEPADHTLMTFAPETELTLMAITDSTETIGPAGEALSDPIISTELLPVPTMADLPSDLLPGSSSDQPWRIALPLVLR